MARPSKEYQAFRDDIGAACRLSGARDGTDEGFITGGTMIIGECPYPDCDECFMLPIASGFEKWTCEQCHRVIWTRHSRLDPWSMTEADFHATYIVDDTTKQVTKREGVVALGPQTPQ